MVVFNSIYSCKWTLRCCVASRGSSVFSTAPQLQIIKRLFWRQVRQLQIFILMKDNKLHNVLINSTYITDWLILSHAIKMFFQHAVLLEFTSAQMTVTSTHTLVKRQFTIQVRIQQLPQWVPWRDTGWMCSGWTVFNVCSATGRPKLHKRNKVLAMCLDF